MQTRSLLDMQEFIRRLIVQIIYQVLLYHLILTGLLFNSFFQDGQEDYMHECIGMLGTHGLKLLIFNPISFVHDSIYIFSMLD